MLAQWSDISIFVGVGFFSLFGFYFLKNRWYKPIGFSFPLKNHSSFVKFHLSYTVISDRKKKRSSAYFITNVAL